MDGYCGHEKPWVNLQGGPVISVCASGDANSETGSMDIRRDIHCGVGKRRRIIFAVELFDSVLSHVMNASKDHTTRP